MTNGFDLDHSLDLWIFKVKRDLDLWPHTWPWPWIFMVKFWNSCISESEGWLTFHKGGGSRSFMTMTIWWPRSGVWIYQIVTGVTSVVAAPSTHLVYEILRYLSEKKITKNTRGTILYPQFEKYTFNIIVTSFGGQRVKRNKGGDVLGWWGEEEGPNPHFYDGPGESVQHATRSGLFIEFSLVLLYCSTLSTYP